MAIVNLRFPQLAGGNKLRASEQTAFKAHLCGPPSLTLISCIIPSHFIYIQQH